MAGSAFVGGKTRISAIEPVGIAREWLLAHPDVVAEFAELGASTRVEAVVGPPYPMLRCVGTPGGQIHRNGWVVDAEVTVEAWGDTDGSPGPDALRGLVLVGIEVLKELEERDYAPWESVVTNVDAAWPYAADDPTGQARWMSTVTLTCHPPIAPELAPEAADSPAPSEQRAYAASRRDFMPRT